MRSLRLGWTLAVGFALLASPAALAAKPLKAPSGNAFYTPPRTLTGKHGDVIWSRTVHSSLAKASRTTLVLYRSTSSDGTKIAVAGTVTVPKGKAPKGGWPVVTWTHGTTGIPDRCAPTRLANDLASSYIFTQLNTWLSQHYALVRTDYEGLGTPGVHPFLVGRSEGRGAIDIIRAARQLDSRIGKRYFVAGHSQGGHAALWAAGIGPSWAPELRLRGVSAFAPASQIGTEARAIGAFDKPSALSGYAAQILKGASAAYPQLNLSQIVSDQGLALFPQLDTRCNSELNGPDSFGNIAPKDIVRQGADLNPLYAVLDANNPDLKIDAPVQVLQGLSDPLVLSFLTDELVKQLRARGDTVDYRTFQGVNHGDIVKAGFAAANKFVKQRLG
jgi:pimeloyl-ACP methyl ester carboxylesterase